VINCQTAWRVVDCTHRRLPAARTPQAVRLLQQQIDLTDKAIDALVYELYGLTAEEIARVSGE